MFESRGLEIIILAVVVLLLFGAKRLPDSARALGKSLRILKSEVGAMKSDQPGGEAAKAAESPVRTLAAPAERPAAAAGARPAEEPEARPAGTADAA